MADKNKEPRIIIDGGRNANVKQSYDKLRLEAKINTILKIMLYFFRVENISVDHYVNLSRH